MEIGLKSCEPTAAVGLGCRYNTLTEYEYEYARTDGLSTCNEMMEE